MTTMLKGQTKFRTYIPMKSVPFGGDKDGDRLIITGSIRQNAMDKAFKLVGLN